MSRMAAEATPRRRMKLPKRASMVYNCYLERTRRPAFALNLSHKAFIPLRAVAQPRPVISPMPSSDTTSSTVTVS